MSNITVLSKQPPGGRCTLYIRYAKAISRHMGVDFQMKYCESDEKDADTPPALLIGGTRIEPSDGVIVSPDDLFKGLGSHSKSDKLIELHRILDAIKEQLMEEWSNE